MCRLGLGTRVWEIPIGVTIGLYRGYIGKVENKMETTIEGLGFRA